MIENDYTQCSGGCCETHTHGWCTKLVKKNTFQKLMWLLISTQKVHILQISLLRIYPKVILLDTEKSNVQRVIFNNINNNKRWR